MVAVLGSTRRRAPRWDPAASRPLPSPLAVAVVLSCVLAVMTGVVGAGRPNSGAQSTAAAAAPAPVAVAGPGCGPGWGTGWMAAPRAGASDPGLDGGTVRMIVSPQLTGTQVRIRLSNVDGSAPLTVDGASVARSVDGAGVLAGTLQPVAFDGQHRVVVPTGEVRVSDPVPLDVEAGRAVAVSLHLPAAPEIVTVQPVALQTSYVAGGGDHTMEVGGAAFDRRIGSWPVLTGLEVLTPEPVNAVVAIGDSITNGIGSDPDADARWSDVLSRRLADAGGPARMAVLNAGISGNQLLADDPAGNGAAPLSRFDRDVAAADRATDVVLNIGTNDIAVGRSADALIGGLRRFAERAQGAGKRVFLTTITPSVIGGRGTPTAVATRSAVNDWIRKHGPEHADGVFDFAAAVADPAAPGRLAGRYDSGDGLHLSDAGYRALAATVDLGALTGSPCLAASDGAASDGAASDGVAADGAADARAAAVGGAVDGGAIDGVSIDGVADGRAAAVGAAIDGAAVDGAANDRAANDQADDSATSVLLFGR